MKIISYNIRGFGLGKKENKFGRTKNLIAKERPSFVAVQESRLNSVDLNWIHSLWGTTECDFIQREKIGNSGGQLLIWDTSCFDAIDVIRFECVIGIRGVWKDNQHPINILNVYGPHDDVNKVKLWDSISRVIDGSDEAWILCGNFNEVRKREERFNCEFLEYRARRFNDFITNNGLLEIPMGGRNFTRVSDDGIKFSKLDRFLVNEKFQLLWKDLSAVVLDRKSSDHCPILLKDEEKNFGPKPFKIFDAWFNEESSAQVVKDAWLTSVLISNRKDCIFRNKLKNVKAALKEWSFKNFNNLDGDIEILRPTCLNKRLEQMDFRGR
ncbi:uncharacterized protein [Rutidosis leptorrhynchoides]|uniref:uncharacterized protein n=1 Tax=Rutidosis leptorrhynchoides TaxID=125765 RepID=UPI003A9A5532